MKWNAFSLTPHKQRGEVKIDAQCIVSQANACVRSLLFPIVSVEMFFIRFALVFSLLLNYAIVEIGFCSE